MSYIIYRNVGQVDRVSYWWLIRFAESLTAIALPESSEPRNLPDWYESRGIASVNWIITIVLPEQRAKIKII